MQQHVVWKESSISRYLDIQLSIWHVSLQSPHFQSALKPKEKGTSHPPCHLWDFDGKRSSVDSGPLLSWCYASAPFALVLAPCWWSVETTHYFLGPPRPLWTLVAFGSQLASCLCQAARSSNVIAMVCRSTLVMSKLWRSTPSGLGIFTTAVKAKTPCRLPRPSTYVLDWVVLPMRQFASLVMRSFGRWHRKERPPRPDSSCCWRRWRTTLQLKSRSKPMSCSSPPSTALMFGEGTRRPCSSTSSGESKTLWGWRSHRRTRRSVTTFDAWCCWRSPGWIRKNNLEFWHRLATSMTWPRFPMPWGFNSLRQAPSRFSGRTVLVVEEVVDLLRRLWDQDGPSHDLGKSWSWMKLVMKMKLELTRRSTMKMIQLRTKKVQHMKRLCWTIVMMRALMPCSQSCHKDVSTILRLSRPLRRLPSSSRRERVPSRRMLRRLLPPQTLLDPTPSRPQVTCRLMPSRKRTRRMLWGSSRVFPHVPHAINVGIG